MTAMQSPISAVAPEVFVGVTAGDLVLAAIARGGDQIALVLDAQEISYRQLGRQLSQLIQCLDAQGLRKGDFIAVLSPNRPEVFLVTAAAYLMGLCVIAINPNSSEADHAYMLEDSGAKALFFDPQAFGSRAARLQQQLPQLRWLFGLGASAVADDILELMQTYAPGALRACADEDTYSAMFYTGGTTGKPKGVVHTHRVTVAMTMLQLADWDWPREIRFLAVTPISHASGAIILPVLLRSGTFVMSQGFDAPHFMDLVRQHRITATFLVPTMLYVLLAQPDQASYSQSSLELIIYGAAPMDPTQLRKAIDSFGPVFMQLFGQTEVPMAITVLRQRDHQPALYPQRLASCGLPVVGNQISLRDAQGQEVAGGEIGEICIRSPLCMAGYWNKPEETQAAFRGGWLHTGDLARCDEDGYLYIVDRVKDMIITGGFNVYSREVETALAKHPAVQACAVVGLPDAKWGEAVCAAVVLQAGQQVKAEELQALVRQEKGAIHAPKHIAFVDQLPMTALGKLDKKALRERLLAPIPSVPAR